MKVTNITLGVITCGQDFIPGVPTEVKDAFKAALLNHLAKGGLLEGKLVESDKAVMPPAKPVLYETKNHSVDEALALVAAETNKDTLEFIASEDERKSVKTAVANRLKELR